MIDNVARWSPCVVQRGVPYQSYIITHQESGAVQQEWLQIDLAWVYYKTAAGV
jgi:hypothetical protein